MTKTFSTLVAALAITASLAVVTPVSAFTAPGDVAGVSGLDLGSSRLSGTDLGSGRVSTMDLGSGR
ncbi:hypothetical protein [Gymnodinialimonas sp.]